MTLLLSILSAYSTSMSFVVVSLFIYLFILGSKEDGAGKEKDAKVVRFSSEHRSSETNEQDNSPQGSEGVNHTHMLLTLTHLHLHCIQITVNPKKKIGIIS